MQRIESSTNVVELKPAASTITLNADDLNIPNKTVMWIKTRTNYMLSKRNPLYEERHRQPECKRMRNMPTLVNVELDSYISFKQSIFHRRNGFRNMKRHYVKIKIFFKKTAKEKNHNMQYVCA